MAALPLMLISALSNAVINLQLCILNLTTLNHRKRRRKRLQLLLMLKDLKAGFHIVVLGRFGSSQMVGTTLDDREDYMETTPRRPRTTTNDRRPGSSPIELSSIRTTQNDPETTRNGRKDYMETSETTQNEPIQPKTGLKCILAPSVQLEKFVFKMAASEGEIDAALFMEECQKYDCLYNKFSKDYKNTKIRTNCWKKVAEKFKISQQEANKKYKYI